MNLMLIISFALGVLLFIGILFGVLRSWQKSLIRACLIIIPSIAEVKFVNADPSEIRSPATFPMTDSKFIVWPNIDKTIPLTYFDISIFEIFDDKSNAAIKLTIIKPNLMSDFFQLLQKPSKNPTSNNPPRTSEIIDIIPIKFLLT